MPPRRTHNSGSRTAVAMVMLVALPLVAPPLGAQTRPDLPRSDLSGRIEDRAQTIAGYLDLLKSPDQATRLAAFAEMTRSGDTALADLAVKTGLSSEDATLQAIALRAGFLQVRSLVAKLVPDSAPHSEAVIKACGNAVSYKIENFSEAKGTFDAHGNDTAGVGQVSGATVSITLEYGCSMTAKLQRDGSLVGLIAAPYKKGTQPMRANFR